MSKQIKIEATVKKITSQKGGNEIVMSSVTATDGTMELLTTLAGKETRVMATLIARQEELPTF